MGLATKREYVSLHCDVINALKHLKESGNNDINWRRLHKAVLTSCDIDTGALVSKWWDDTEIRHLVARLCEFCGGSIPDPLNNYQCLLDRLLATSLIEFDAVMDGRGERDDALRYCYDAALGSMYLSFNLRLSLTGRPDKAGSQIWDCLTMSVYELAQQRKDSRYEIEIIHPEWTATREKDIGLLLADYILPDGYPLMCVGKPDSFEHQIVVSSSVFDKPHVKSRLRNLKQGVTQGTYRRLDAIQFITGRVSEICWAFSRYFSEHIESPYGGSFIELHISRALTDYEVTYEAHGAFEAFRQFTNTILEAMSFAYNIRATSNEYSWNPMSEPLCDFIMRHSESGIQIQYNDELPRVSRKELFPVVRHVLDRLDMGLWQIPLPGLTHAGD